MEKLSENDLHLTLKNKKYEKLLVYFDETDGKKYQVLYYRTVFNPKKLNHKFILDMKNGDMAVIGKEIKTHKSP